MSANNRSLRDTIDAYSLENASNNCGIATRMVDAITNYYQNVSLGGSFYGLFYYIGVHKMDDNNPNFFFSIGSDDYRYYNYLVSGHGIDVGNPANQNSNYGRWDGYGAFNQQNQGLKHYHDSVQFGLGISTGTAPGITNSANSGYMSKVSGTPANGSGTYSSIDPVIEGNNTYRTVNIKLVGFRGIKKTDPINNSYIYNQGDGTEELYGTGPISIGNAANNISTP